jgi:hypothetical protein
VLHDGDLLRTDDGGHTWRLVKRSTAFVSLSFVTASHGFALTGHARVMQSTDGGRSWETRLDAGGEKAVGKKETGGLEFLDARAGWTSPYQLGRIFRTTTGGASWKVVSRVCTQGTSAFSFVSATTGFRICGDQPGAGNQDKDFFRTVDGGVTWRRLACARPVTRRPTCKEPRFPASDT